MNPASLILIVVGACSFCGAVLDWSWVMNGRRAQTFVSLLGRGGARAFYAILGFYMACLGTLMAMGVLKGGQ